MSRFVSFALSCIALFCMSATAFAEESPVVGIGVGLSAGGNLVALGSSSDLLIVTAPAAIYVPINITPNIRIEPLIGFYRAASSSTTANNGKSGVTTTTDSSASVFAIGVGAFYKMAPIPAFQLYVGPRLGLMFPSTSTTTSESDNSTQVTVKSSRTGWGISGAFGGEYSPVSRISFGAEIALGFTSYGTPSKTITPDPGGTPSNDTSTVSAVGTSGTFFARFYFL